MTLLIALVGSLTLPARADDYGPHGDIRAIYHDLPIIHAADGLVEIDGVVVKGDDAVAQWHSDRAITEIDVLFRKYNRWWLSPKPPFDYIGCRPGDPHAERSPIWKVGQMHLAAMQTPTPPKPTPTTSADGRRFANVAHSCDIGTVGTTSATDEARPLFSSGSGYDMWLTLAANDKKSVSFLEVIPRAPTAGESWVAPSGDGYFFFSVNVRSESAIHVQAGTAIDVWFPFALDTGKKYSLTIAHTDQPIGPIDGGLKNNTLHFVLPAFDVMPGAHLIGEIDGD